MATLKDIRNRISSTKNTRQITRAMKMVSAAKLRRAQDAILSSRPYAYRIYSIMLSLARREGVEHPLLEVRPEKRIRLVVLSGERGLCGAFNTNVIKATNRFLREKEAQGIEVSLDLLGKKAYDIYRKKRSIGTHHEGILLRPSYATIAPIAESILASYRGGEFDAIYLVYNEFKSAIQQTTTVERLIPVSKEVPDGVVGVLRHQEAATNYIYEPSERAILDELIPRHFRMQIFRAVLESVASEHGARMSAMENATKNASEMIESLTLDYNKARQAAITKELMEIVGGVEAMR